MKIQLCHRPLWHHRQVLSFFKPAGIQLLPSWEPRRSTASLGLSPRCKLPTRHTWCHSNTAPGRPEGDARGLLVFAVGTLLRRELANSGHAFQCGSEKSSSAGTSPLAWPAQGNRTLTGPSGHRPRVLGALLQVLSIQ